MFATHNNPCLLPEELLPEGLSVDSKSTNAPLQRPDKNYQGKRRKFSGNKHEKAIINKARPLRSVCSAASRSSANRGKLQLPGKTRKGVFSRIKKTLQLYHWLKCGIGMIICIYWLEE